MEDIALANELLKEVLLAKSDELTKACRDFLETLKALLHKEKKHSFFRSEIRTLLKINPHNLNHYQQIAKQHRNGIGQGFANHQRKGSK